MSTKPRMSAPIGRLKVSTSEGRERRPTGAGRWRSAELPREAEMAEVEEQLPESTRPSFYPFPLRNHPDGNG